ncbi:hypothetical protein ACFL3H_00555 [Gemmatimonadota bacterium]
MESFVTASPACQPAVLCYRALCLPSLYILTDIACSLQPEKRNAPRPVGRGAFWNRSGKSLGSAVWP